MNQNLTKFSDENAVAAATSLQSCSTQCNPVDGSPPGSLVLGILQARTPEWVAISKLVEPCLKAALHRPQAGWDPRL